MWEEVKKEPEPLTHEQLWGEEPRLQDGHEKVNVKVCDNCQKPLEVGEIILCNNCLPF